MITLIERRTFDQNVFEICPCCHVDYSISEPHGRLESGQYICPVCFEVCYRARVDDPRQIVKCFSCTCNELYDGFCPDKIGRPMIECPLARDEMRHDFACLIAESTPADEQIDDEEDY